MAVGTVEDGQVSFEIIHRFPNGPVEKEGGLFWPWNQLLTEIISGLRRAREHGPVDSLGVDSWAVDYAFVDKATGVILAGGHHYRDPRTEGIMESVRTSKGAAIYEATGIQFLPFNTLFQLMAEFKNQSMPGPGMRGTFLMVPDIFHFWLTSRMVNEVTNASSTQMLDVHKREWCPEIVSLAALEPGDFPTLVEPGTDLGHLSGFVEKESGLRGTRVVLPATHDTASAVASIQDEDDDWAFVSSGTWSLVGVVLPQPLINDRAREANFTNEAGIEGTTRFLKNLMGLWILQECRRAWGNPEFSDLYAEAEAAKQGTIFDPDEPQFLAVGDDMPERVLEAIRNRGGSVQSPGEIVRSILASLATKTAKLLDEIEALTGRKIKRVYIVGGGSQIELLNRFIAEISGRKVVLGEVEATIVGNLLVQARAFAR